MLPHESPATNIFLILQAQAKLNLVIGPISSFGSSFVSTSAVQATQERQQGGATEQCPADPA